MSIPVHVQRHANWLLYIALFLALVGGVGPIVVQWATPDPFRFSNLPLPVDSPVQRGGQLHVTVGRCNTEGHDVAATRTRALQQILPDGSEGQRYILPADSSTVPSGCTVFTAVATTIPDFVEPGMYRLEGILTFRGRWKTVDASYYTELFEVVE